MHHHPFEPIVSDDSLILILGSFPSIKSFENQFYYAHPKNQFWTIISKIFEVQLSNIDQKRNFLNRQKIALWDVVESCERENSLDSNLKNIKINKIDKLLEKYPSIRTIAFTGRKAEQLYKKEFKNIKIATLLLPSPSPAYCRITIDEKAEAYREFFDRNLDGV